MNAVFIEIGPLLELHYTGIASLTAAVADYWMAQTDVDACFIYEHVVIVTAAVRRAVELRSGATLRCLLADGSAVKGHIENVVDLYDRTAIISCNVKTAESVFDYEFQIIYDLTTLITPEFHHPDTINYHGLTLLHDVSGNAETFAISHCTKNDLVSYCDVDPTKITVHHPGVNVAAKSQDATAGLEFGGNEPYVLVIGTIEPRKNIEIIFQLIAADPGIAARYTFIFVGRSGWLTDFQDAMERRNVYEHYKNKRIIWFNFVSDAERDALYRGACFAVYPSIYEGFGLPAKEARAVQCPVLASFSSSIPEAGGTTGVIYFDPLSLGDFKRAFADMERQYRDLRTIPVDAKDHDWDGFNSGIKKRVLEFLGSGNAPGV